MSENQFIFEGVGFIEGFISDLPQSIDRDIFHSSDLGNENFWDLTSLQIMAEWSDQSGQASIMQDKDTDR